MRRAIACLGILILPAALDAHPTAAQSGPVRSPVAGFAVGAGVAGTRVSTSTTRRVSESTHGLNLEIGWGLSGRFLLFLSATGSVLDANLDEVVGQGELGLRYLFRAVDRRARPYLEAGLAARQVQFDFTDGTTVLPARGRSAGLLMGAGLQLFVRPRVAVDMAATITGGNLSGWQAEGTPVPAPDMDANSTSLRLGVRLWPTGR